MTQTKKIRLVIEADVNQDTELTPEVVARIWGSNQNYPELLSYDGVADTITHNQTLLSALLANPAYQQRILLEALRYAVGEAADDNAGNFHHLAGLPEPGVRDILYEEAIEELPANAKAYFHEQQDQGVLSESTELVTFSLRVGLTRISVEEVN